MSSYGRAVDSIGKKTCLAILFEYLNNLKTLWNILKISFQEEQDNIYMDSITIRNLELLRSSYDGSAKHWLLHIINHTITPMWNRLLQTWLLTPTKSLQILQQRHNWIEAYLKKNEFQEKVFKILKQIYDIGKVSYLILNKKNSPYHWLKLKISLNAAKELNKLWVCEFEEPLDRLCGDLNRAIKDWDFTEDESYIQDGFSDDVDKLRKVAFHSDDLLLQYQQELVKLTDIQAIKIKYITNQGYFIEVTKRLEDNIQKILAKWFQTDEEQDKLWFIRRQTLKSAERYTTPYLEKLQHEILSARDKLQNAERDILVQFQEQMIQLQKQLLALIEHISHVDIFATSARFFEDNNWTKPDIKEDWDIEILQWRHPIIEKYLSVDDTFIPNDLSFAGKSDADIMHIITWPNMGGKSTYLRQNSLILLLAHIWFYVPAKKCKTHILDWLFARVWSWDILAQNQSTFMTEMIEVSNILNNATKNSFIIFDELWRGTSTYDWMAISQAVVEYILQSVQAKTLFATHYHELIKLADTYKWQLKNFSVAVHESQNKVIFMKKVVAWGISKSYGIEVARLAGIPQTIVENAKTILDQLESKKQAFQPDMLFDVSAIVKTDPNYDKIKQMLGGVNINNITPMEAMVIVDKIMRMVK